MDVLILRLEAPLMSFGAVQVDDRSPTLQHPTLSLVTGLLANALGYKHRDYARTQRLQGRLTMAARRDRAGREIVDYQIAHLGGIGKTGWTTRGVAETRERLDNVIRHRHYLADAAYTVALVLEPADEQPTLEQLEEALRSPARPLFIGRKCCPPSAPLLGGRIAAPSLRAALERAQRPRRADAGPLAAWWPDDGKPLHSKNRQLHVSDMRDWANQIHTGRRLLVHGLLAEGGE